MLETLKAYQAWRRGEDKRSLAETDLTPTVIGHTIDWAIAKIEAAEKLRQAADIVQASYFDWYDAEHDHESETDVALHSRMEKLRDTVKEAE
jgi:hypothetical protein